MGIGSARLTRGCFAAQLLLLLDLFFFFDERALALGLRYLNQQAYRRGAPTPRPGLQRATPKGKHSTTPPQSQRTRKDALATQI